MATTRKPRTKTEIEKEALALANSLPDEHLLCRLVGHNWNRIVPDRVPPFGRIVSWECKRCTSVRDDIIAPATGDLLARTYRYAEGYVQKPDGSKRGQGHRMAVPVLRLALMRRDDAQVEGDT